jgi:hypothetical protein
MCVFTKFQIRLAREGNGKIISQRITEEDLDQGVKRQL